MSFELPLFPPTRYHPIAMNPLKNDRQYKISGPAQYAVSIGIVLSLVGLGLAINNIVGYRVVALLLMLGVSIAALLLDIIPVVVAALLSALLWDFLFIPPRFTFSVGTPEDRLMLLMYFVIAMIHAVLTFKIRQYESKARKKEERANTLKLYSTLFNSLSHELRTPITTILGATDSLLSSNGKLSDQNKSELLNEISIASLRLNQQVGNLLNMSRLESGVFRPKKDWVDVKELIYTSIKHLEPAIANYRLNVFVPDNMPLVKLDFGLMEQVLDNLAGNAIQHNPPGTGVVISASIDDNNLIITVADDGKGFPDIEIERVFDKFYRLHGSRPGGTGLGLSIARGLVEAHGGSIGLKNLPLSGAVFTITIPAELSYINNLKNE
jgi:two-component system sensor histidine kinase KdpD